METEEIKQLLNAGNMDGLEILFNKYHKSLFKIAYYLLKDEEESRDLIQELFLKIWSQRSKLFHIENIEAYLNTSVRNMALDIIKKNDSTRRNQEHQIELDWNPSELLDHEEYNENLKEEIRRFVSELPPKCRLIFSLHRFEGLTTKEIADYLQISPRTVEKQLSIGLNLLREKARDRFDTNGSGPLIILLFFSISIT